MGSVSLTGCLPINHNLGEKHAPHTIQTFVDDTKGLCDALDIERAKFVGHSMGGHIAQYIADQNPELVEKLVLLSSEHILSDESEAGIQKQIACRQTSMPLRENVELFLPLLFSKHYLETRKTELEIFLELVDDMQQQPFENYLAQVDAIRQHDSREFLSNIATETFIICGDEDKLTPFKHSQWMAEQMPNATLVDIPNCGHLPQLEYPDKLLGLLTNFFALKPGIA